MTKPGWWQRTVEGATVVAAVPIVAPLVLAAIATGGAWLQGWDPFGAIIFGLLTFTCLVVLVIGSLHLKRHLFPPPPEPEPFVAEVFARPGEDNALTIAEALGMLQERRKVSQQEARRLIRERAVAGQLRITGRWLMKNKVEELPDALNADYWQHARLSEDAHRRFDEQAPAPQTEFPNPLPDWRHHIWKRYTDLRVDYLDFIEIWPTPKTTRI